MDTTGTLNPRSCVNLQALKLKAFEEFLHLLPGLQTQVCPDQLVNVDSQKKETLKD